MRKFLFFAFLIISTTASAQWTIINGKQRFAKGLGLPTIDTIHTELVNDSSQIVLRPQDSSLWWRYKGNWRTFTGSGGGISGITANNGLTANTSTNVQLGGTLIKNTTIEGNLNTLTFHNNLQPPLSPVNIVNNYASTAAKCLYLNAPTGQGLIAEAGNTAIYGISTNGFGAVGQSTNGVGIAGVSTTYLGGRFQSIYSTTNDVKSVIDITRTVTYPSTAANGVGVGIDFNVQDNSGAAYKAGLLGFKYNDVTTSARKSSFEISLENNNVFGRKLLLSNLGGLTLDKYGVGSFTGTSAYSLNVDASGNIIEATLPTTGVTSVATGYGLSGGTITSTGTLLVDSATLSNKYLRIIDTTAKFVNNVTAINDSIIRVSKGATNTDITIRTATPTFQSVIDASNSYGYATVPATKYWLLRQGVAGTDQRDFRIQDNNIYMQNFSIANNVSAQFNLYDSVISLVNQRYLQGSGGYYSLYLGKSGGLQYKEYGTSTHFGIRYDATTRDTTNWQNYTLIDKKYFNDRLPTSSGGTVTSVATGYGLSGGTITNTGTLLVDTATLSTKYVRIVDTSAALSKYVPYVGATTDLDMGVHQVNAQSFYANGSGGNGHIHLKHQNADATGQGQTTTIFADNNGDFKWKNAGNYYTTLKTSGNAADAVYTYPSTTTTLIGAADTSVLQRKNIAAYSFMGNNTASAANATPLVYKDLGEQVYSGTITWTFTGAAPSGTTTLYYRWSQVGKTVNYNFYFYYTTASTTATAITFDLPTDMPTPQQPTGSLGTNSFLYKSNNVIALNQTAVPVYSSGGLRKSATGYEWNVSTTSGSWRWVEVTGTYFVN